jgi:hypothetical protein
MEGWFMSKTVHVFWQSKAKLEPSFREALRVYYSRIPYPNQEEFGFHYGDDIDALLRAAAKCDFAQWCVVHGEGSFYPSQLKIVKLVDEFIAGLPDNILVAGHLIDRPGQYCGLHEQFLVVNLDKYREIQRPQFGAAYAGTLELPNYQPGESIHDNYTPKRLDPAPGVSSQATGCHGWGLVSASLAAGLPLLNISEKLRREKLFLYPDDQTNRLNESLRALFSLNPMENITQNRLLFFLIQKKLGLDGIRSRNDLQEKRGVRSSFLYNSERFCADEGWYRKTKFEPLQCYIGPASGALELATFLLYGYESKGRMIFYDINPRSLEYKKDFWDNFSGQLDDWFDYNEDFKARHPNWFFEEPRRDFNYTQMLKICDGKKKKFYECFMRLKDFDKSFVELDLMNPTHSQKLLRQIRHDEVTFLSISDIFLGQNELLYGYFECENKFLKLMMQVMVFDKLLIQGKNTSSHGFLGYSNKLMKAFARGRDKSRPTATQQHPKYRDHQADQAL